MIRNMICWLSQGRAGQGSMRVLPTTACTSAAASLQCNVTEFYGCQSPLPSLSLGCRRPLRCGAQGAL